MLDSDHYFALEGLYEVLCWSETLCQESTYIMTNGQIFQGFRNLTKKDMFSLPKNEA